MTRRGPRHPQFASISRRKRLPTRISLIERLEQRELLTGTISGRVYEALADPPSLTPALFHTATAYRSLADSPLDTQSADFLLEDFEDHLLNALGVTAQGSRLTVTSRSYSASLIDSVDSDDGAVDGGCTGCDSLFGSGTNGITFRFDPLALGGLPTQAGIVWTDGLGNATFEAFDSDGTSLGVTTRVRLGDASYTGTVTEDRFFGVEYSGGISSIRIAMSAGGIEVDHLQFGELVNPHDPLQQAPGLAGWTVYSDSNRNGRLDQGEASDVTDAQGDYTLTSLPPGNHQIRQVSPAAWSRVYPPASSYSTTLMDGQQASGFDFGNEQEAPSGVISGRVWEVMGEVATPTLFNPSPYRSLADSPLDTQAADFYLEDFEDHLLNSLGVTAQGSRLTVTSRGYSSSQIDSVDGDDGSLDGSCTGCDSLFGGGTTGITFRFDALALGGLPSQVGIVWTDGIGNATFEAFDQDGVSLGVSGPARVGDGSFSGTVSEDRFFGAQYAGGIASFRISMSSGGMEVDHLQYGSLVNPAVRPGVPRGASGWDVYLDGNNNGQLDSGEDVTTTNANGAYEFTQLAAGAYVVRQIDQSGWSLVEPTSGRFSFNLNHGAAASGLDFINQAAAGQGNRPLVAVPVADQSATVGEIFIYTLPGNTFTDPDGDPLTIQVAASTLPGWLTFNAGTRTFSGVPSETDVATETIAINAFDPAGATASTTMVVTVGPQQGNASVCDQPNVQCVYAGDEQAFLQTMQTPSTGQPQDFYVYPDAVLNRLDIVGRVGDTIRFVDGAEVRSAVQTPASWSDNRGVVNIVQSSDLTIDSLRAHNSFQFRPNSGIGDEESSTALNISGSDNIRLQSAVLTSEGKGTVWVHSDSSALFENATIDCYYFCVGVGASDVTFNGLTANQFNPAATGDSHSTFWVSSSMRSASDNAYHEGTQVTLTDATINMRSGRAIVSGNGAYSAQSDVFFEGDTAINITSYASSSGKGWVNYHSNYHGFAVYLRGNYPPPTQDIVGPGEAGEFGRFIINTYQGGGQPSSLAPSALCEWNGSDWLCTTSEDVA